MARAKAGESGVGYGKGCPLPSRLGGLAERCEPKHGPGGTPTGNVLVYFEGRSLIFAPIYGCPVFIKQRFMSFGGKARFGGWGQLPLPQRRSEPVCRRNQVIIDVIGHVS